MRKEKRSSEKRKTEGHRQKEEEKEMKEPCENRGSKEVSKEIIVYIPFFLIVVKKLLQKQRILK